MHEIDFYNSTVSTFVNNMVKQTFVLIGKFDERVGHRLIKIPVVFQKNVNCLWLYLYPQASI